MTSEHLADHLENYLNHPEHCPHGGSIPKKEEVVHEERRQTLESYPVGTKVRIARVLDEKELLDYLVTIDLNINEEYEIVDIAAYESLSKMIERKYPSASRRPARFLSIKYKGVYLHV